MVKGLGGQAPITAYFSPAGANGSTSQSNSRAQRSKKRKQSTAFGRKPTCSPKKKAKIKESLASISSSPTGVKASSSSKKFLEHDVVPDSQMTETNAFTSDEVECIEPTEGRAPEPKTCMKAKESTPAHNIISSAGNNYYPTPPLTHMLPSKHSTSKQTRGSKNTAQGLTDSVAPPDKPHMSSILGTPKRVQKGDINPLLLRNMTSPLSLPIQSPTGIFNRRLPIQDDEEIIPSSQTQPLSPQTPPKRKYTFSVGSSSMHSPSRIRPLVYPRSQLDSNSRLYPGPLQPMLVDDRPLDEIIPSSQTQDLTELFSSPGRQVVPTSQLEEEELVAISPRFEQNLRIVADDDPPMSTVNEKISNDDSSDPFISSPKEKTLRQNSEDPRIVQSPTRGTRLDHVSPKVMPKDHENNFVLESQRPSWLPSEPSYRSPQVRSKSHDNEDLQGRPQAPLIVAKYPPHLESTSQESDPFSQIDLTKHSWEPERLSDSVDPNATEEPLPSILSALLSVKPKRIQSYTQESIDSDAETVPEISQSRVVEASQSTTESEPSQVPGQGAQASRTLIDKPPQTRHEVNDDSETESESGEPSVEPTSTTAERSSTSQVASPTAQRQLSTVSPSWRTARESQSEVEDSQISDTPFSIPSASYLAGVTQGSVYGPNSLPTQVREFLEIFDGEESPE